MLAMFSQPDKFDSSEIALNMLQQRKDLPERDWSDFHSTHRQGLRRRNSVEASSPKMCTVMCHLVAKPSQPQRSLHSYSQCLVFLESLPFSAIVSVNFYKRRCIRGSVKIPKLCWKD